MPLCSAGNNSSNSSSSKSLPSTYAIWSIDAKSTPNGNQWWIQTTYQTKTKTSNGPTRIKPCKTPLTRRNTNLKLSKPWKTRYCAKLSDPKRHKTQNYDLILQNKWNSNNSTMKNISKKYKDNSLRNRLFNKEIKRSKRKLSILMSDPMKSSMLESYHLYVLCFLFIFTFHSHHYLQLTDLLCFHFMTLAVCDDITLFFCFNNIFSFIS